MPTLDELLQQHEEFDLEFKAAQGRDGRGELPNALWSTYSAMANTGGGTILLGVEEYNAGEFRVLGLQDIAKVRKVFWDNVNNTQVVNINLLLEQDVTELEQEGKRVLCIRVPRATRLQRPVYLGANPLTGTYRRNYEGDYKCDSETVRRMLAEAVEDVRDARILAGYGLDDLNSESLAAYRNEMKSTFPNHPFLVQNDLEFLTNIGASGKERLTGEIGLTLAGLLMFGRLSAILDAVPHYVVDYQERPLLPSEQRWVDRVTTDGTWSGNLYDFFRRVFTRLTADLKVPFRLEQNSKRIDENHVHEALREALVNSLIHADFTGRISILIVKRPDSFGFRNPGDLRLPIEQVLRGGQSDCRNRRLQKMFQFIGAGEQAGSGYPKIRRAWMEQHWRYPLLDEKYQPEQTVLRLPTTSLLPTEVLEQLDKQFGAKFRELGEIERLAVVTACLEEKVTNQRLRTITTSHASDLTAVFKSLVSDGFLVRDGIGWGTYYRLSGLSSSQQTALSLSEDELSSPHLDGTIPHLPNTSPHLDGTIPHLPNTSPHLDGTIPHYSQLLKIAEPARKSRSLPTLQLKEIILALCRYDFVSLRLLAELLGRKPKPLQNHYISSMVAAGILEYRHPEQISHPDQGYRTVENFQESTE